MTPAEETRRAAEKLRASSYQLAALTARELWLLRQPPKDQDPTFMNNLEVSTADGKYTVIQNESGHLRALRVYHGLHHHILFHL